MPPKDCRHTRLMSQDRKTKAQPASHTPDGGHDEKKDAARQSRWIVANSGTRNRMLHHIVLDALRLANLRVWHAPRIQSQPTRTHSGSRHRPVDTPSRPQPRRAATAPSRLRVDHSVDALPATAEASAPHRRNSSHHNATAKGEVRYARTTGRWERSAPPAAGSLRRRV